MFDLNAIVSAALNAAIQAATEPLVTRIAALENANDILHRAQHDDMVAMRDRIAALEDKLSMLTNHGVKTFENVDALTTRVVALENNPAQGVDTQAPSVLAAQYTPVSNEQVKAALQEWATKDALVEHLDNQEWFWEKLQNRIDSTVEAGLDDHCSNYDHDSYDAVVSDSDDYAKADDLEDFVRDAVSNLTFEVSVS